MSTSPFSLESFWFANAGVILRRHELPYSFLDYKFNELPEIVLKAVELEAIDHVPVADGADGPIVFPSQHEAEKFAPFV